jgi:hypothetical protein
MLVEANATLRLPAEVPWLAGPCGVETGADEEKELTPADSDSD